MNRDGAQISNPNACPRTVQNKQGDFCWREVGSRLGERSKIINSKEKISFSCKFAPGCSVSDQSGSGVNLIPFYACNPPLL